MTELEPEALPLLAKPQSKVRLVGDPMSLEQAVSELAKSKGPIAIDAERASGFRYSQRAYLLQIKPDNGEIYLVDPVASELSTSKPFVELASVLRDREWILHAATQDLGCLAELKLTPGALFDTELGARLAGLSRVGLGSLTEELLGQRLAKEHSAADWSTRPLPESWLTYAAIDVEVLHDLRSAVWELLRAQSKQDWATQEFSALLSFSPKPAKPERWRSTSGISKIRDQRSLEVVRRMWLAREELAQKLDVAPGRLIPDSAIALVATELPKTKAELAANRRFSGRASRSYLTLWWDAIASAYRAQELPEVRIDRGDQIPNHRSWPAKFPEVDRRYRQARGDLSEIANKLSIPLENLLTPDLLRQLCFNPPQDQGEIAKTLSNLGAREWQIELTANAIAQAFTRSLLPLPTDDQPAA